MLIIVIIVIITAIFLTVIALSRESYNIGFKDGKRDLSDLFKKHTSSSSYNKKKDTDERVEHHFDMDGKLKRVCWVMPGDGGGDRHFSPELLQEVQKYYPYAEYTKHNDNLDGHLLTMSLHDKKDKRVLVNYILRKGAWHHCAWDFDT